AAVLAGRSADRVPGVRGQGARARGARGEPGAVPALLGMVVEGANDVEAAEILGAMARGGEAAELIRGALVGEFTAAEDAAVRLRLVQAAAELPSALALEVLPRLARDEDRTVARTAAALAGVIEERLRGEASDS